MQCVMLRVGCLHMQLVLIQYSNSKIPHLEDGHVSVS